MPTVCVGFAIVHCSPRAFASITEQSFFRYEERVIHCIPFLKGRKLKKHLADLNARRVAIWGVPRTSPDSLVQNYFRQYGEIENAFVLFKPAVDKPDAFVVFASKKVSKEVLAIEKFSINGLEVKVGKFNYLDKSRDSPENKLQGGNGRNVKNVTDNFNKIDNISQNAYDRNPKNEINLNISQNSQKNRIKNQKINQIAKNNSELVNIQDRRGSTPFNPSSPKQGRGQSNTGSCNSPLGNMEHFAFANQSYLHTWPRNVKISQKNYNRPQKYQLPVQKRSSGFQWYLRPSQSRYHLSVQTCPLYYHSSSNLQFKKESRRCTWTRKTRGLYSSIMASGQNYTAQYSRSQVLGF